MKPKIGIRQPVWLALAIGSFFSLAQINPAMAQEQVLRTLTVTGQGVEQIPTTLTQVRLGVQIEGENAPEVQEEVARRTAALVDFLRSRQVERLQTAGIRLQPTYDRSNNQRRLVGYTGTNTVSFRLQTEQIGSLLDEAVKAGATRIDGVSFTATEEAIAQAKKEALRKATLDAQQQAAAVFGTLNLTSREVVSIQINGASPPQPRVLQAEVMTRAASAPSTPVIGGEQAVQGMVTLQISY